MKKIALFALGCATLLGGASTSLNAQEVSYVEDCTQGVLLNPMKSNWFITAQGGNCYNVLMPNLKIA